MKEVGLFECFVLVAFWFSGLAAFLIGGMSWLGYVFQMFLLVALGWVVRKMYQEYSDKLLREYQRGQIFNDWSKRQHHLKGMDS